MSVATPLSLPLHQSLLLAGRRRLTLLAELGRGSVATVFRGILEADPPVRRALAVKVFDLSASDEPEAALLALSRAAQRAACVTHPNAVQTYEIVSLDSFRAAILTELVDGTTLERMVAAHVASGRRLPLDLALFVTTEIAEALSGARTAAAPDGTHAGMSHLDVAPHQVLLSVHGEVKLSDFALSQVARSGVTRASQPVPPRWSTVAPEIARGRAGDTRSDVFSLGILLREMLVGPRFGPEITEAAAVEHAREGHVPPTFVELQLPPEVRAILGTALQLDPARRFPHATAMAYELRRVALSMGVGDARVFLRAAVHEVATRATAEGGAPLDRASTERLAQHVDDEPTEEVDLDLDLDTLMTPQLVEDRSSGLIRKADRASKP